MEVIILAGGFGKRLQNVIEDIPKPMAPINNRPFLDYLLDYLIINNAKKVVFSVYYKYDLIKNYYGNNYKGLSISYSIDKKELGTGGAIKNALLMINGENTFVINGDTYFNVNLSQLYNEHHFNNNDITFSLKPMSKFDRYGYVITDASGSIISFKEKKYCDYGEIDGGIYLIKKSIFDYTVDKHAFSFNNFIIDNLIDLRVGSLLCDDIFIDIGTPEDYKRAHKVLAKQS